MILGRDPLANPEAPIERAYGYATYPTAFRSGLGPPTGILIAPSRAKL